MERKKKTVATSKGIARYGAWLASGAANSSPGVGVEYVHSLIT